MESNKSNAVRPMTPGRAPSEGQHPGSRLRTVVEDGMRIDYDLAVPLRDGGRVPRGCVPPGRPGKRAGSGRLGTLRQARAAPIRTVSRGHR